MTARVTSHDCDTVGNQQPQWSRRLWVAQPEFPRILESPGFFLDFPGPRKLLKISLVLESPGNESLDPGKYWKMKILE